MKKDKKGVQKTIHILYRNKWIKIYIFYWNLNIANLRKECAHRSHNVLLSNMSAKLIFFIIALMLLGTNTETFKMPYFAFLYRAYISN